MDVVARASLDVRQEILDSDVQVLDSADILAEALWYQGKYEEAEVIDRRALAGYEKVLGVDHPDTLTSVGNLALLLQYQGKYEQAAEMKRRALAGMKKVQGVDHPNTLANVSNLASVGSQVGINLTICLSISKPNTSPAL
jgi:tetratricopeptide (TPR) repeat protein